ncbi:MAG: diguanylate cyclase [Candidatus Acidulodesulfobacterium acidiphilum]|uniref:Diguanylate cyclase n=1 Tax=Candidatus Acidulodesulfobacterium acidiphilum TaxID=2597224 RepID=A0A520XEK8_9DELT|nr:MAG: diguanylate cyclase [Candidatus Acidulodesulfobacterium acidiphilum]
MPKINLNSIKFKIYFLFILSNIIIFSVGIFIAIHYIALYSRKSLKEELKSNLMSVTMAFLSEKNYMLEKANEIVAHNFNFRFIQKTADSKKISSIVFVKIKNGKIDYIKKFKYKKYSEKVKASRQYYGKLKRIILTKNRYIFMGFARDKSDRLINITVIYRLLHKNNGYLIILNRHVTSDYLKNIRIKKHIPSNIGIYYGSERSAISFVKNNKYEGLSQMATKKQLLVLKKGISVYTSINVDGTPFYIYNVPIKNYGGKIIGIFGVGIKQYAWLRHLSKLYTSIIFFIALYILTILIFVFISKRFSKPFYDLLKNIESIDPNNPKELGLEAKYKNKENEFYEFAKAITVLNNTIIEKQKENNFIIKKLSLLNDLSYKLSIVFTLEYAVKTFAEGLCSIKKPGGGLPDSLHINMFDTVNKKTVTSLIYDRKKGSPPETDNSENADKIILKTANIEYEDYLSNCKLLKNGKNNNLNDTVDNCEFKGTAGSYTCFPLKISDEIAGTISIDSEDKHFFTQEIIDLIKEIINIASPVFAKLILIETNRELALTDSLTGIHNRRFMYEFVKREIVRAARNSTNLSCAILDIDKFKNINDNYGHNIGDAMLVEFTNDLKSVLLRKQDIITRYGGDEFVVVLPDTSKEKAMNLMEKLRVYIENKIYTPKENLNLNITISVGVSDIKQLLSDKNIEIAGKNNDPDEMLSSLLKIADDNLYKAKDFGRNKVEG